ncbi:type ISP restriction/modification enzyme [Campylobacter insulaenigrae]|uniref:type ISP restriction/modification enzyme n=1 Tax=Campylobacter insulaenigrae TaxID=260714 RepID=UPI0027E42426|nr:type ISP restriction/modification enzyme [Campylobacter insulaenigrae]
MGSNSYTYPLYLYPTERYKKAILKQDSLYSNLSKKIENFTPEFRKFINTKYKECFCPECILGYIYAVLSHKNYRNKYLDFLK